MSVLGASNPEYVTARIRARRASLFDEEDYRKLVRMGPSGIARFMEESEYEREINDLGARHSGVDLVEFALAQNLAKHFHQLLMWANGDLNDLIARYLRRYDVWNIKTVIRGLYTEASADEIEGDLILAGELPAARFQMMIAADSLRDAIEVLDGTRYYPPLVEAYGDYEEHAVLVPLENALDHAFYAHLLEDIPAEKPYEGPMAKYVEFLQAEIDFRNLRNAYRLARSGADLDPSSYVIEGGRLFGRGTLERLVANPDELDAVIRESVYGKALEDALDEMDSADSLIGFEHTLDTVLLAYTERLGNVYPVSITAILSYILAKEREVDNIRAIARGKEAGLDETQIEEELVIV